ncbi:MAG: prepilin-type N-terminal cleavage/methylation domain-containing protein [Alphaproteobacteria bacterium]|nr:MAG: prepilin-type N-terminal cleavage/methylation domain-containing protein [Alphaproteobacteria bacterium]
MQQHRRIGRERSYGVEDGAAASGFTLIEVLVAFAIVAVMLLALFEGTTRGLRAIERSERHARLLELAENHLAEVGTLLPVTPGRLSGREGDYEWETLIEPLAAPPGIDPATLAEQGFALYGVEVHVRGPEGAEEWLQSLRLAPAAP